MCAHWKEKIGGTTRKHLGELRWDENSDFYGRWRERTKVLYSKEI